MANGESATFFFDTNIESIEERIQTGLKKIQRDVNQGLVGRGAGPGATLLSGSQTANLPRDLASLASQTTTAVGRINERLSRLGKDAKIGDLTGAYNREIAKLQTRIAQTTGGRGLSVEIGLKFAEPVIKELVSDLQRQLDAAVRSTNPNVSGRVGSGQLLNANGIDRSSFAIDAQNTKANEQYARALRTRNDTIDRANRKAAAAAADAESAASLTKEAEKKGVKAAQETATSRGKSSKAAAASAVSAEAEAKADKSAATSAQTKASARSREATAALKSAQTVETSATRQQRADSTAADDATAAANNRRRERTATGKVADNVEARARREQATGNTSAATPGRGTGTANTATTRPTTNTPANASAPFTAASTSGAQEPQRVEVTNLEQTQRALDGINTNTRAAVTNVDSGASTAAVPARGGPSVVGKQVVVEPVLEQQVQALAAQLRQGQITQLQHDSAVASLRTQATAVQIVRELPSAAAVAASNKPLNPPIAAAAVPQLNPVPAASRTDQVPPTPTRPPVRNVLPVKPKVNLLAGLLPTQSRSEEQVRQNLVDANVQTSAQVAGASDDLLQALHHVTASVEDQAHTQQHIADTDEQILRQAQAQAQAGAGGSAGSSGGTGGGRGSGGQGGGPKSPFSPFYNPDDDGHDDDQTLPPIPGAGKSTKFTRLFDLLTGGQGEFRRLTPAFDPVTKSGNLRIAPKIVAQLEDGVIKGIHKQTPTGFNTIHPQSPAYVHADEIVDKRLGGLDAAAARKAEADAKKTAADAARTKREAETAANKAIREAEQAAAKAERDARAKAKTEAEQQAKLAADRAASHQQDNRRHLTAGATRAGDFAEGVGPIGSAGSGFVADTRELQTRIFKRTKNGFEEIERGTAEFETQIRRLRAQQERHSGGGGAGGGVGGGRGGGGGDGGIIGNFLSGFGSRSFGAGGEITSLKQGLEGLSRSAGVSAKYAVIGQALYGLQGALAAAGAEVLDFEDSTQELNIALDQGHIEKNLSATQGTLNSLADSATVAGANVGQAMDLAASAIRAFGTDANTSQQDLEKMGTAFAAEAAKIALLTKTDIADASGNLKATALAFDLNPNAQGFSRVSDAIVGAKSIGGGDEKDLSQAGSSAAVAAKEAGFTMEETYSLLSKIIAETDEGGQLAASRFSKITAIIGGSAGTGAITKLNQSLIPADQIDITGTVAQKISQLSNVYGKLNEAQRQQLVNSLGGTANARELIILLQNANTLIKKADEGFSGESEKEFQKRLDEMRATLTDIQGQLRNIISALVQTGAIDVVGVAFKGIDKALDVMRQLLQIFNLIPYNLQKAVVYIGEFVVAAKLLRSIFAAGGFKQFFNNAEAVVAPTRAASRRDNAAAKVKKAAAAKQVSTTIVERPLSTGGATVRDAAEVAAYEEEERRRLRRQHLQRRFDRRGLGVPQGGQLSFDNLLGGGPQTGFPPTGGTGASGQIIHAPRTTRSLGSGNGQLGFDFGEKLAFDSPQEAALHRRIGGAATIPFDYDARRAPNRMLFKPVGEGEQLAIPGTEVKAKRTRSITGIDFRTRKAGGDLFAAVRESANTYVTGLRESAKVIRDARILQLLDIKEGQSGYEKGQKTLKAVGFKGLAPDGRPIVAGDASSDKGMLARLLAPRTGKEPTIGERLGKRLSPAGGVSGLLGGLGGGLTRGLGAAGSAAGGLGKALGQDVSASIKDALLVAGGRTPTGADSKLAEAITDLKNQIVQRATGNSGGGPGLDPSEAAGLGGPPRATFRQRFAQARLGGGSRARAALASAGGSIANIGRAAGPELAITGAILALQQMKEITGNITQALKDYKPLRNSDQSLSFKTDDLRASAANLSSAAHELRAASNGLLGIGKIIEFGRGNPTKTAAKDAQAQADSQKALAEQIDAAQAKVRQGSTSSTDLASTIDLTTPDALDASLKGITDSGRSATTTFDALMIAMNRAGVAARGMAINLNPIDKLKVAGNTGIRAQNNFLETQQNARNAFNLSSKYPDSSVLAPGFDAGAAAGTFGLRNFTGTRDNWLGRFERRQHLKHGTSTQTESQFQLTQVDSREIDKGIQDQTQQFLDSGGDISSEQGSKDLRDMYISFLVSKLPKEVSRPDIEKIADQDLGSAKEALHSLTGINDPKATIQELIQQGGKFAGEKAKELATQSSLGIGDAGPDLMESQSNLGGLVATRRRLVEMGAAQTDLEAFDRDQIDPARVANNANLQARDDQKTALAIARINPLSTQSRNQKALEATNKKLLDAGYDPKTGKRKTVTVKHYSDASGKVTTSQEDTHAARPLSGPQAEAALADQAAQLQAVAQQKVVDAAAARRAGAAFKSLTTGKIIKNLDPRDELGNAEADVVDAKEQLDFIKKQKIKGQARSDAELALTKAQQAESKERVEHAIAARNVDAIPESELDTANRALKDAKQRLTTMKVGTDEYNKQLAEIGQDQNAVAIAADAAKSINRQLKIDLTDPVQVACEALQTADDNLKRTIARNKNDKDPAVRIAEVGKATLAKRQAEAAVEAAQFQKFLSNAQTADQLGTISHKAYLSLLQGRADQIQAELATMDSTSNQFQQLTDERNQLLLALKSGADTLAGVFNIGDIKVPTPYEVRKAIKENDFGTVLGANNAFATAGNVTNDNSTQSVVLNGVPIQQVMKMLQDMFGLKVRTTATRRTP